MISFSHIYKAYGNGTVAVRDISFEIEKGEFAFLTGPSGAGKTTLFRLISAFDRPTSGELVVAGQSLNGMKEEQISHFRRKIGVVYQDFRLIPRRTIFENVALPLEIRGTSPSMIERKVREALEEVGLAERLDIYPDQLSGGEQQRVSIARALIHRPAVLIADEPTGNLDPELSWEIMNLFERVNAHGTTVFVATHDHEMVRRKGRRVVEIRSGTLARA